VKKDVTVQTITEKKITHLGLFCCYSHGQWFLCLDIDIDIDIAFYEKNNALMTE